MPLCQIKTFNKQFAPGITAASWLDNKKIKYFLPECLSCFGIRALAEIATEMNRNLIKEMSKKMSIYCYKYIF